MLHANWSEGHLVVWAESIRRFLLLTDGQSAGSVAVKTAGEVIEHPFAMEVGELRDLLDHAGAGRRVGTQFRAEQPHVVADAAPHLRHEQSGQTGRGARSRLSGGRGHGDTPRARCVPRSTAASIHVAGP